MSTIMDIYFSPSLSDMRRKLETAEEEMSQRQCQSQDQQNKIAQEDLQYRKELEERKLKLEDTKNIRDNDTKRYIAEISNEGGDLEANDMNNDGIADPLDINKFELDVEKARKDYTLKLKALDNDMLKHKDSMEAKKIDQSIARIKKKTTT